MAYRIVFTNGEKRELVVEATKVLLEGPQAAPCMVFYSDSREQVALVPVEKILYCIKNSD